MGDTSGRRGGIDAIRLVCFLPSTTDPSGGAANRTKHAPTDVVVHGRNGL